MTQKIFCGFDPRVFFEFTIILTFLTINGEMLIFFREKMICKDTFETGDEEGWPIYCFVGSIHWVKAGAKAFLMKCFANQNWKKNQHHCSTLLN